MNRSTAGTDFDCLIVGAGVIGTTMASVLIARKLVLPGRVALIGARPDADALLPDSEWGLRVFALSRASQRLLELCGVWQTLPVDRRMPYERMSVWDAHGQPRGKGSLTFDCAELGEPDLGTIVEGRALQTQCSRAANAAGVVSIAAGLESVVNNATVVRLRLSDGRELTSRLVIAADGIESRLRELLGIETAGHAYHQDALVAHVRTAQPHGNTAWQRFLDTGPLAFLPLPDGRSSIVWSSPRAAAKRLQELDAAGFGAALTAASGGVLGACQLTTPVASFPLQLKYALDYVRPRAALLGDAAHVVHPLAGQGLNLGLLDCASLAEVLADPGSADVFGDQRRLRRYERRRRSENLVAATALDALERLFANDNPVLSRLRGLGLQAVGRLPLVKRELAQRALGLGSDVPAFLQEHAAR